MRIYSEQILIEPNFGTVQIQTDGRGWTDVPSKSLKTGMKGNGRITVTFNDSYGDKVKYQTDYLKIGEQH